MAKISNLKHIIGNTLILSSLVLLIFIYYPVFAIRLPQKENENYNKSTGYFLTIPKISAEAPVISDVDPWNKENYGPALQKGIAQAKGSSFPGEKGTTFLFAHSSDVPWRITRYNTAFLRLGELNRGDRVILTRDGKEYLYTVSEKKEVWPNDTKYLKDLTQRRLILQTCTPIGTALKRLLVFADPV